MRAETLALIEATLDQAGAEGLARAAAGEELAALVTKAAALEAAELRAALAEVVDAHADDSWSRGLSAATRHPAVKRLTRALENARRLVKQEQP